MYIEVRKNAFYVKSSVWDKDTKKTKSSSIYLGSNFTDAQTKLIKLKFGNQIMEELSKAQENYAYKRAIESTKKLWLEIGETKAGLKVFKLFNELTKAQIKYDEKAQNNSDDESQNISDYKAQNKCDNKAQNKCDNKAQNNGDSEAQKLEDEGQTVLPLNPESQAQNISDSEAQKICDKCGTEYQEINKNNGEIFIGCPNWGNH